MRLSRVPVLLLTAALSGCADSAAPPDIDPDSTGPRQPASLRVTHDSLPLAVGDSIGLFTRITARAADSSIIPNESLSFDLTSSDVAVAAVSGSGKVRSIASGRAWVRVSINGLRDSMPVISYRPFVRSFVFLPHAASQDNNVHPSDLSDNDVGVIAVTQAGLVRVFSLATRSMGAAINVGALPADIAITRDGARAYTANYGSLDVSVIEVTTATVIDTLPVPQPAGEPSHPVRIRVSADGSTLYVMTNLGQLHIMDAGSGIIDTTYQINIDPVDLDLRGDRLSILNLYGVVRVLNTTTGAMADGFSVRPTTMGFTFGLAHADTLVVGATEAGLVFRRNGENTTAMPGHAAVDVALTPDHVHLLVAAARDGVPDYQDFGVYVIDRRAGYTVAHYPALGMTGATLRQHAVTGVVTLHTWGGVLFLY